MAPPINLSDDEKVFIRNGIALNVRNDGRTRNLYRPMELELDIVSTASGSARLILGTSDILVAVNATLIENGETTTTHHQLQHQQQYDNTAFNAATTAAATNNNTTGDFGASYTAAAAATINNNVAYNDFSSSSSSPLPPSSSSSYPFPPSYASDTASCGSAVGDGQRLGAAASERLFRNQTTVPHVFNFLVKCSGIAAAYSTSSGGGGGGGSGGKNNDNGDNASLATDVADMLQKAYDYAVTVAANNTAVAAAAAAAASAAAAAAPTTKQQLSSSLSQLQQQQQQHHIHHHNPNQHQHHRHHHQIHDPHNDNDNATNQWSWKLFVDVLILQCDGGNIYDAVSVAVKAALFNTKLPKVVATAADGGRTKLRLLHNVDPFDDYGDRLNVDPFPVLITICSINDDVDAVAASASAATTVGAQDDDAGDAQRIRNSNRHPHQSHHHNHHHHHHHHHLAGLDYYDEDCSSTLVVDPTVEEQMCSGGFSQLVIGVVSSTSLTMLPHPPMVTATKMSGLGSLRSHTIKASLKMARTIGHQLNKTLIETLLLDEAKKRQRSHKSNTIFGFLQ